MLMIMLMMVIMMNDCDEDEVGDVDSDDCYEDGGGEDDGDKGVMEIV